ncbi:hypothetical protein DPMN_148178 [Dreissena polymorpha]|uniref:Uncharacterized protein n=1 Tax=Dreissena polymorpha TaxID=45954 RepID=A0A9D4FB86_DREPO|nr:hypothetical protein DPMN_148178 [Dreissena polymorpha]
MDGIVLATFTDPELLAPEGVLVTSAGQVLVCGADSHNIIQVNSDGRKKLSTLATRMDGVVDLKWRIHCQSATAVPLPPSLREINTRATSWCSEWNKGMYMYIIEWVIICNVYKIKNVLFRIRTLKHEMLQNYTCLQFQIQIFCLQV